MRKIIITQFILLVIVMTSCHQKEPFYEIIEGKAIVLVEMSMSDQGIDLSIPLNDIVIEPLNKYGTEYRGLVMPKIMLMTISEDGTVTEPLKYISNNQKYRFYGFHKSLTEVHKRYREAGGTGVYFPENIFNGTKFFDIHKVEVLP